MKIDYTFTPQERSYFERLQMQFQTGVNSGISLICTQQDLPGQWRVKPDGSGIERADLQSPFAPEAQDPGKAANGVA